MADHAPPSAALVDSTSTHAAPPTNNDLLPKIIPQFADRHLVYPLMEFLGNQEDQDPNEVNQMKLELLRETNMADFCATIDMQIRDEDTPRQEWTQKREQVLKKNEEYDEATKGLMELMENSEVTNNLRSDKIANMNYLKENHSVTDQQVTQLYEYGQFLYSMGDYEAASSHLITYNILAPDSEQTTNSVWGRLACDILLLQWEEAVKTIDNIRESLQNRPFANPVSTLHARVRLLHWALFPLFHNEVGREKLVDLFFTQDFINSLQTGSPWLIRYLATAVISNRNRTSTTGKNNTSGGATYQKQMKDLIRVVRQEGYEYQDPITEFIRALYVDFDFEEAQKKLGEAERVLKADFFTNTCVDDFVEAARHLISESYCKIHQRIDIK
jgi:translation initiation factor 3 subunit E